MSQNVVFTFQKTPLLSRTFRGPTFTYVTTFTMGLASSPGRFIFLSNYAEGRKNGLVFIAWVIVPMRYSITQILGNRIFQ